MSAPTGMYHSTRKFVMESLGGKCSACGITVCLELHLVDSDGGKHHSLFGPARQVFYLRMMLMGNLLILCSDCHKKQREDAKRAARAAAWSTPPFPLH